MASAGIKTATVPMMGSQAGYHLLVRSQKCRPMQACTHKVSTAAICKWTAHGATIQ